MGLFRVKSSMKIFRGWSVERIAKGRDGEDGAEREDMLYHFLRIKSLDGTQLASYEEDFIEAMNIMWVYIPPPI